MSQGSESGLTCSDSISIYCYSHIHESKVCSFTHISWFWTSIIAVQALWHITLQRWDCLIRWMLFFLLFRWFYQVTFFSFNAILFERSFYHWNLRSQAFSVINQCLQQHNGLYLLHVQLRWMLGLFSMWGSVICNLRGAVPFTRFITALIYMCTVFCSDLSVWSAGCNWILVCECRWIIMWTYFASACWNPSWM